MILLSELTRRSLVMTSSLARSLTRFTVPGVRSLSTGSPSLSWLFSKDKERTTGHSTLLSKDTTVYEMVTDKVVPAQWDSYLNHQKLMVQVSNNNPEIKSELVASWGIVTGDAGFKAFHLYKYPDGWTQIDSTRQARKSDVEFQQVFKEGLPALQEQSRELSKGFSFWPSPDIRQGNNVYDIRSYSLKPGSMYDWSNYWARGIKFRSAVRPDIPYCGFFTQLGELHCINHIWCYKSMADRKQCREDTWHYPEWNDVVANTVPLVNTMTTRILEPLEFSPTQ